MKKKIFMISSLVAGIIAVASFALVGANPIAPHGIKAGSESYGITFDSTNNKLHDHPGVTAYDGDAVVKTDSGNDVGFSYYHAMGWRNTWHVFGSGGYFYNTDPIHGMESISFTFNSADVPYSIYYFGDNSLDKSKSFVSKTGSSISFDFDEYKPNYFKLVNTDENANLNIASVRISLSYVNSHPTVILLMENDEMGSVSGGGEKKPGSNVTIIASPNKGYRFVGWYDGNVLISNKPLYSFVIGGDNIEYSAKFTYESYNLVVTSEDETKGTVSGAGTYDYLEKTSISAATTKGYTFTGWYDGENLVSADNPYEFMMPYNNLSYVARFSTNKYTLSLENENYRMGSTTGGGTFKYGASVTIKATPKKGISFLGWFNADGELVSCDQVYTFSMPCENLSYSACFDWTEYSVSVAVNDSSMGSITGTGSYTYDQEVTLVATPNEHYSFFGWYEDDNLLSQGTTYSFSMPDKSLNYVAKFVKNYKISVSSDESMGTVTAPEEWGEGLEVTVKADAKDGYAIDYWCDANMNKVSQDFRYTFQMPAHDAELYAVFTKGYKFVTSSNNLSLGDVNDDSGQYKPGITITVKVICGSDNFVGWYDGKNEFVSHISSYSFIMPSNDYALTGMFCAKEERCATAPALSADGKTVKYGLYPQKNVNDSSLISILDSLSEPESNGWYLYNGGYYAKATAKPYERNYRYSNGDKIEEGKEYWFECEPIEWKVLSNDDKTCFILSNFVLDSGYYESSLSKSYPIIDGKTITIYPNNYEYSFIRGRLNHSFYNSAFGLGSDNIMSTLVDNSASSTMSVNNEYACNDTNDKIFLLSYRDAEDSNYGFTGDDDRKAYATDFAKCKGVEIDSASNTSGWWLRSPNYYGSGTKGPGVYAECVNNRGYLSNEFVDKTYCGIRPAMKISLD